MSLEIPSRLAIDRIDSPSAKCACLIAPQSCKLIILHLGGWPNFQERFGLFFEERRHFFSFWLPGKQYEKADAEVVAAWKKEQHTRLDEAFSDPDTVVLAEDEMVLAQARTTQKVWIPQGTSPAVIETNGTR